MTGSGRTLKLSLEWVARRALLPRVRSRISHIRHDAIAQSGGMYSSTERRVWLRSLVEGDTEAGDALVALAWVHDMLVGYAELDLGSEHLSGLFVDPRWQRHGVGSTLLRASQALARQQRCASLGLSASHDAISFYEANGCRQLGQVDFELEDDVVLTGALFEIDVWPSENVPGPRGGMAS